MQPTHGCGTLRSASSSRPTQSEKAQLAPTPSLQPYAAEAATVGGRGCNRVRGWHGGPSAAQHGAPLGARAVPAPGGRPLCGSCGAPKTARLSPRRRVQGGAGSNAVHMLAVPLGVARHDGGVGLEPHPPAGLSKCE